MPTVKKPTAVIIKSLKSDYKTWANKTPITTLANTLRYLAHSYYNDEPVVDDKVFDYIKNVLETRDPTNKFLKEVGAPVTKDAVKLPYFMPSLDKIVLDKTDNNDKTKSTKSKTKPTNNAKKLLDKFISKYSGPYVLSDKLDGVSGLLTKQDNQVKLFTRGDGFKGQNISHLIKYLIPQTIIDNLTDGIAIRGEIIMSKSNFESVKKKFILKNARNTVSGIVNAKHPEEELAKLCEFIGYNVLSLDSKMSEQLEYIEELNFPTVNWSIKTKLSEQILEKYFNDRIKDSDYEIDGIVVMDNSTKYKLTKNENPDYGFAFKNQDVLDSEQVEIKEIEWHGSKDSYLVPTVIINPIELDGVTVTCATGHNAKFILDNKLGPGSIVNIIRSGSVIPHITETVKGTIAQMPDIPMTSFIWSNSNVDIIYTGKDKKILDEIKTSYITFFFKKIGVKYLSEGIVSKLVENGYNDPIEVIGANVKDLYEIHGLGKKMIDKIYANIIEGFNGVKLETIMSASNVFGRGLGSKKLALILKNYPDILEGDLTEKAIETKVLGIKGFDTLTANRFAKNVKKFKAFYEKLEKVVDIKLVQPKKIIKPVANSSKAADDCVNIFYDKSVVFTGFRKLAMEDYIESCGGKVSTSVSGKTFLVVYANIDGIEENNKYKKAKSLGVKLMSDHDFDKKYMK